MAGREGAVKPSPAFQFYANDWLANTTVSLMTPAQEGGLLRLHCHAWRDPLCSLPNDDVQLAKLSRLHGAWPKAKALMMQILVLDPEAPERLFIPMLRERRKEQEAWREKSQQGGINSGLSRRSQSKGGSPLVQPKREPNGHQDPTLRSSSAPSTATSNVPVHRVPAFCKGGSKGGAIKGEEEWMERLKIFFDGTHEMATRGGAFRLDYRADPETWERVLCEAESKMKEGLKFTSGPGAYLNDLANRFGAKRHHPADGEH